MKSTFIEWQKVIDKKDAEIKANGTSLAETKEKVEKMNSKFDELEKKYQLKLDELESKMNRPGMQLDKKDARDPEKVKSIFNQWARTGQITKEEKAFVVGDLINTMTPQEQKSLSAGSDTLGGYLVTPPEYVREITKNVVEFSPIRSVARVVSTTAQSIKMPKRTGTFGAQWVAEQGTRAETTGLAYGLDEIPNHEMYALVDISQQMLEDSAFNMEAELNAEFSEQFGVAEGTAFVSGNAVGRPQGILTNASVSHVVSADADEITAQGLINLFYAPKAPYIPNAVWLMNRSTLKTIRQLKDGDGNYLWMPGIANGAPATILGKPYVEATDMPDIAVNAFPVVFGDIRRAYTIVDRIQITVQRDPYTQATYGNVRFIARKRVGGQVVLAEAIYKLEIAAS